MWGGGTGELRDLLYNDFVPPPSFLFPPQKFSENNRENNSLLPKIPPTSQPPRENPGQYLSAMMSAFVPLQCQYPIIMISSCVPVYFDIIKTSSCYNHCVTRYAPIPLMMSSILSPPSTVESYKVC